MSQLILKGKKFTWHHFSALSEDDFETLKNNFKFHPLDFDDLRERNELPKLDIYKYYLFGILAVPAMNDKNNRVEKSNLAIFIGSDYIVTITNHPIHSVERFFKRAKRSTGLRREIFGQSTGYFVYKFFDYIFRDSKVILQELSKEVLKVEHSVYNKHSKETTMQLSLLRRDLLFLRHILDPQRMVVKQFSNVQKTFIPKSLDVYFDDITDTLNNMWMLTENLKNIVDDLFEVNEALLTHKTNETIRILTIISVILMPPTLMTGYYGMNVQNMPFVDSIGSVSIVIISSLLLSLLLILLLDRKK